MSLLSILTSLAGYIGFPLTASGGNAFIRKKIIDQTKIPARIRNRKPLAYTGFDDSQDTTGEDHFSNQTVVGLNILIPEY